MNRTVARTAQEQPTRIGIVLRVIFHDILQRDYIADFSAEYAARDHLPERMPSAAKPQPIRDYTREKESTFLCLCEGALGDRGNLVNMVASLEKRLPQSPEAPSQ